MIVEPLRGVRGFLFVGDCVEHVLNHNSDGYEVLCRSRRSLNEYEKALLRVGQLHEIGIPEEEIIQLMMSEKFYAPSWHAQNNLTAYHHFRNVAFFSQRLSESEKVCVGITQVCQSSTCARSLESAGG